MPIYEYRCQACGKKFEKLVRMSVRDKDIECPACGRHRAQKTVSLLGSTGKSLAEASLARPACGPSF